MGWLTDWTYRKSTTLSRASGTVTDYQMKLLVGESSGAAGEDVDCGGLCATDFDDLRFTTSDGETLLDYWIESITGTTPNQLATVWIEFDSIGTDATTFYMYYGNAGASAVSSGTATFLLFDHFDDASLNGTLWNTTGTVTEAAGTEVTITGSTSDLRSKTAYGANTAIRALSKNSDYGNAHNVSLEDDGLTNYCEIYAGTTYFNAQTCKATSYIDVATTVARDTSYHIFDVCRDSTTSVIYRIANTTYVTETTVAKIPIVDLNAKFRRWATGTTTVDWVLVRQWLVVEPTWGSWQAEEESSLSPSASPSVSPSTSPSLSPSASVSPSESPSISPSASVSPSISPSLSPSASVSPSISPSGSPSVSPSVSPSPVPEGDVTYTLHERIRLGKKHFVFTKIVFGANSYQSYPPGGIPVSETGLGLNSTLDALIFLESNADVYLYEWDRSANKIRIFSQARVELTNYTILTSTSLEVLGIGW